MKIVRVLDALMCAACHRTALKAHRGWDACNKGVLCSLKWGVLVQIQAPPLDSVRLSGGSSAEAQISSSATTTYSV